MADIFTELRERRVLPAVGVYAASCWVLIEIVDRLVERYLLSPYITDIVFWGLYSMIPAVILVAWSYGRPGKDKATRAQKVGVPINIIATVGLLISVFGDKNLGATANMVTVANEVGQQETHYVTNESFRRRMAVFFFDNTSGDPNLDWLQYGVTELLVQDLQQDPFVLASSPWNNFGNGFYSRMRKAGFKDGLNVPLTLMKKIAAEANRQYFVEGSVDITAGEYILTARIWETSTLDQVEELVERNWGIYAAVDQLSKRIRDALEVPESGGRITEDLPLAETYGESEEALKAYIEGLNARLFENDFEASNALFDRALEIDPNFVLAWFVKAVNMIESGNLPAAQEALAKVQELDYRLPARDRAQAKAMAYRFSGEHEKLMAFLHLQAKIHDDARSHNNLATMFMLGSKLEEAKKEYLLALERDALNVDIYLKMSTLERASGNMDGAIAYARSYQEQKPEDIDAHIQLGDLLRDGGNLDAAEDHYKQAQILQNNPVLPTLKLSLLTVRQGDANAARAYLSEAESYAQTPLDKTHVRQAAAYLESRLGKIHDAISQTRAQEQFLVQSAGPLDVAISIYVPLMAYYVQIDDLDAANHALETATAMLEPPLDQFLAFGDVAIKVRENDLDGAMDSLERAQALIDQLQLKVLEFNVYVCRAIISEAEKDFAAMAGHYEHAIELIEYSVIAGDLRLILPLLYAELAKAQIETGSLDAAGQSIDAGSQLDPSEPVLWVSKARLQKAKNMPQLALASANYALAIWKDADEDYLEYIKARDLAAELTSLVE